MNTLRDNKYINTSFLKKLFNKSDKRPFKFDKTVSSLITKKTDNPDITSNIKKQYKNITIPYDYDEIKHLSKLIKDFYHFINILLINDDNEHKEINIRKNLLNLDNDDFKKIYNSLYYCLKVKNKGIYKISKKGFGRTKNYFVFKVLKEETVLYIVVNIVNIDTFNPNSYKVSIDLMYEPEDANDDYIKYLIKNYTDLRESKSRSSSHTLKKSSYSR
jgi:hypothetical protein